MNTELSSLIEKEGWRVITEENQQKIIAYGETFPYTHPFSIHAKLYRTSNNPEIKYLHFKAMHDYMWPDTTWHYWTERRFREHCNGHSIITYAGGAGTSKSYDAAKIAILFWLANPKGRTVVVASTSLESLSSRIWGYVIKHLNKSALFMPIVQLGGQSPKVLYDYKAEGRKTKDTIHGMFAIAAKQGEDEKVISSWIGRHPDEGIMVILDEATDMPVALMSALPNLRKGVEVFQCMAIGNSLSIFDLHGALSTPKSENWNDIDPLTMHTWPTTQENGICLFFSCYESPAIHEPDIGRREVLSKFLITEAQIEKDKKLYGKDSDSFWRFTLGYWRSSSTEETVISRQFITDFDVFKEAHWSGLYPLTMVAGLDPAFSTGGDRCVLRLAILGVDTSGRMVLDFQKERYLYPIEITAKSPNSADIQIADAVIKILDREGIPLENMCIDANGQGRALGEVIKLRKGSLVGPIKIYSVRDGNLSKNSFDVITKNAHELWFAFRDFIQHLQIRGIDHTTAAQFTTRLVITKGSKQTLEQKKDYKRRMGAIAPHLAHSPDEADAAALCLQSAIIKFGFSPGQTKSLGANTNFYDEKLWVFKEIHGMNKKPGEPLAVKPVSIKADFASDISDSILAKGRIQSGF